MNSRLVCSFLVPAVLAIAPTSFGAPPTRGGTDCVDVVLTGSCSQNFLSLTATLTNCGKGADTILGTETLIGPDGSILSNESMSFPLKAGKSASYTYEQQLPTNTDPGTYQLTLEGDANKGTGYDSTTMSLTLPCP